MENNIAEIHERVYAHLTEKYPELSFTLRQVNNAKRLEQGYWFHGNETYLTFSFWDAWASMTMRPAIALEVYGRNGSGLYLHFWYTDANKEVHNFLKEMATVLNLKESKSDHFWIKEIWEEGKNTHEDLLKAIDRFMQTDKKILDLFIKEKGLEKDFPKVDAQFFNKNKQRIEKFRKGLEFKHNLISEKYQYKSVKLQTLSLKNITVFKEIDTIRFHNRLTCFIGLNGSGKTTVLRTIANSIISTESLNYLAEGSDLDMSKLRRILRMKQDEDGNIEFEKFGEIVLTYDFDGKNKKNHIEFVGKNKRYDVLDRESDFALDYKEGYLNTLVLAFPQEKTQKAIKEADNAFTANKTVKENLPNINDIGAMITDEPDNRFIKVEDWLLNTYAEALNVAQENQIEVKLTKQYQAIEIVFEVLSKITGENISLGKFNFQEKLVWLKVNDGVQLMSLVSDGYSNLFGWVGNLISRLYQIINNTPFDGLRDIPAIVLIDEIDTYLHPSWQSKILAVLVDVFSNIQFIVTTHSPYVVGSIPTDLIKLYVCKNDRNDIEIEEFTEFTPYGANIERLSEKLFGVKGRFVEDVQQRFETLSALINKGDLKESKEYLSGNFADIDSEDPELKRSKMLIRTKEILAK